MDLWIKVQYVTIFVSCADIAERLTATQAEKKPTDGYTKNI